MTERNEKGGKRRSGSVFRCESCSKVSRSIWFLPCCAHPDLIPDKQTDWLEHYAQVYRHPSCLVKHRWQHSPHWQESSKLLLSKHQQVQVLEVRSFGPSAFVSVIGSNSTIPIAANLGRDYSGPPPPGVGDFASRGQGTSLAFTLSIRSWLSRVVVMLNCSFPCTKRSVSLAGCRSSCSPPDALNFLHRFSSTFEGDLDASISTRQPCRLYGSIVSLFHYSWSD